MSSQKNLAVVVTGDLTIDWAIHDWGEGVHMCPRRGGAMLLADLIRAAAGPGARVLTVPPVRSFSPGAKPYHHTYAQLSRDSETKPWRVEKTLGLDCQPFKATVSDQSKVKGDTSQADVVVIDDAGFGFRNNSHRELWPSSNSDSEARPWVLLKTRGEQITQGNLWKYLQSNMASRLVVVTSIADIRLAKAIVSRGLSWERTARALAGEVVHNPRINGLSGCAYTVISFGPAGAILLASSDARSRSGSGSPVQLFFDPKLMEDTKLTMPRAGYTSTLAAAMCVQILRNPEHPDVAAMAEGVRSGLAAMRLLQDVGLGKAGCPRFPVEEIAKSVCQRNRDKGDHDGGQSVGQVAAEFSVADVPPADLPAREYLAGKEKDSPSGYWTILDDNYPDDLDILAERVVVDGPGKALKKVPLGEFGKLLTVDRQEIESLRSIRTLIEEYLKRPHKAPLSIAVFGSPGSGKSFTVKELINSLPGITADSNNFDFRTFNLAQFRTPDALVQAFHEVRDLGLSGRIPLIFWDEIDSNLGSDSLGWLRYFLAPMQDGTFQEGQVAHPIGRSIFVFAGGTSRTLEHFRRQAGQDRALSHAKVPDFLSRLRGYIEILGPDREISSDGSQPRDPYFVVRRAILLRSLLAKKAPHLFSGNEDKTAGINSGVLRGFLAIPSYKHGARSMEAIIDMSQLAGQASFTASCLPAQAQLDLHVDGNKFLSIVREIELPEEKIGKITDYAHKNFEAVGSESSDFLHRLGGSEEDQVRRVVRGLGGMLEEMGYAIVPAGLERTSTSKSPTSPSLDAIEGMASLQHSRWRTAKLAAEWTQDREVGKERRTHPSLTQWEDLTAPEKANWRMLIVSVLSGLPPNGYDVQRYTRSGMHTG